MNGYERVKAFVNGEEFDRPPFMPLVIEWVSKQKGMERFPLSEELKDAWRSEEVRSDGHHILFARYPGVILKFSTSSSVNLKQNSSGNLTIFLFTA